MAQRVYDTADWQLVRSRVLARDGDRCTVGRLFGVPCHSTLHAHHAIPVDEGGAPYDEENIITVCAAHHPLLEAFRRRVNRPVRCRHHHPYPGGREECERRMRQRLLAA